MEQNPALQEVETSKKKKKPKLTKEEKLALQKEKKLLKQQQMLEEKKQVFRDHLSREIKYTKMTYDRVYNDWIKMCSDRKYKDLKEELMDVWQSVNRFFDRKDNTLKRLLEEMDIAEEQYQRNYSKHCQTIDYLISVFNCSLEALKRSYDTQAEDLIIEYIKNVEEKGGGFESIKTKFEDVLHATNLMRKNVLMKLKDNFEDTITEIVDSNIEQRYYFKEHLLRKMEKSKKAWIKQVDLLQEEHSDPKRRKIYAEYVMRLKRAQSEFEKLERDARRYNGVIHSLEKTLTDIECGASREIFKVKSELSFCIEKYWQQKINCGNGLQRHNASIRKIASKSHHIILDLEKQVKYGELLLSLAGVCRGLETEEEKVVPWPKLDDEDAGTDCLDAIENDIGSNKCMQNFFNRVSKVQHQVQQLEVEKQRLIEENSRLQQTFENYCDMCSYNQSIASLRICGKPTVTIPVQEASDIKMMTYKNRTMK